MTGQGRVALITGAGSGIGRETAILLSEHGYALALVGRDGAKLAATGAMVKTPWTAIAGDLGDGAFAERMVDSALERFGRVDALINNAGWSSAATIPASDRTLIERVFAVNAIAAAIAVSRVWPAMERQARAEGAGGVIVNVSSMATVDPFDTLFAYAAAKGAVNVMARSIAKLGGPLGIRGFAVAPGAVETPLLRAIVPDSELPTSRTLSPRAVAEVIAGCVLGECDDRNGDVILVPSP